MAEANARRADVHSGCVVTEAKYVKMGAVLNVVEEGVKLGRVAEGVRVGIAVALVMVCVLARRARVETMRMRVISMTVVE